MNETFECQLTDGSHPSEAFDILLLHLKHVLIQRVDKLLDEVAFAFTEGKESDDVNKRIQSYRANHID